jgi:hypothetical protein
MAKPKPTPYGINPNEYARAAAEAVRRGGGSHAEARNTARSARQDIKKGGKR